MTHIHCAWEYQAQGVTAAQMNLFYGLAVIVLDGMAFTDQYREERLRDPRVLALIARMSAHVDPEKIAVVGYCFGGKVALDMARSGADLDAVVAIHAALAPSVKAEPGQVEARILVLTGGADAMVPPEQVQAFKAEMAAAGADARVVTYPDAKHGFTNPDADRAGMPSVGYDAAADRASFEEMVAFLRTSLGS